MLLSEAIRLGAMLRPQAFGYMFDDHGGSCAYGAAAEAIGFMRPAGNPIVSGITMLLCHHPEFRLPITQCPQCHYMMTDAGHLNDTHHWTREHIADWVEGIERERGLIAQTEAMLDLLQEVKK